MVRTSILLFFIDTLHLSGNANANSCLQSSVADPEFYPYCFPSPRSWIPEITTATKEEKESNLFARYRNKLEPIHKES
jgi:hypothetical protein